MGIFNKIKDILFEEVEEENDTSVNVTPEVKKPIAEKIEPQRNVNVVTDVKEVSRPQPEVVAPKKVETYESFDNLNERDLFKSENTFPFPDFDEEEFSQSVARREKPTTNVLEYEKKKKIEKKYDMGRFERVERTEIVEKKKFKPSPIISPVYGILNEDYKIEDIKDKSEVNKDNSIDFNSVRKKAFGDMEKQEEPKEEPKQTFYEESVTVKLSEPEEEKQQKVKTIDELLEDTSDIEIDIPANKAVEEPISVYDDIEEELEEVKEEQKTVKTEEAAIEDDDTLENDLFDLIDSMYDNREDGEY